LLIAFQVLHKTSCHKKTLEPVWDESFSFDVVAGISVLHVEMFDAVCADITVAS
jgi:Ca2+-dependent lipid-binding protein